MLKISRHSDASGVRLELEGRLEGPWVPEFERAFEQARGSGRIVVDLDAVTFIDDRGRGALAAAYRAGAGLKASLLMTSAVVEEIQK